MKIRRYWIKIFHEFIIGFYQQCNVCDLNFVSTSIKVENIMHLQRSCVLVKAYYIKPELTNKEHCWTKLHYLTHLIEDWGHFVVQCKINK
jgi:hypothetical protein